MPAGRAARRTAGEPAAAAHAGALLFRILTARLRAAHAHARHRRRCFPRSCSARALPLQPQDALRDHLLGHLRGAARRPLALRLARAHGAALDARRIRDAAARLRRQQVRARGHPHPELRVAAPGRAPRAGAILRRSSSPPPPLGRHLPDGAARRARGAARRLGVLLDRRDQHDGAQPLSAEAPGAPRQPRARLRASDLLARTDRLLGVILLGNNLVNAAAAALVGVITIGLLGRGRVRADDRAPARSRS